MKGTKELVRTEKPRFVTPFEDMEKWFEESWMRPFSLLRSPLWAGLRPAEFEEFSPTIDVYEEDKDIVVKADLPGVKKSDVTIDISDNMLTISGEKKHEDKVEKKDYYRYESSYGRFSRSFELPGGMDMGKAKAHLENGVLEIRIPKSAEAVQKSKTIAIE
ncbi:MAG: Hsp20/alpha crystallin family protein [Acidobacteriota bacterium]